MGLNLSDLKVGDRVYRYVWTGGQNNDVQFLTVQGVGPRFVRATTDEGSTLRFDPAHEQLFSAVGLED